MSRRERDGIVSNLVSGTKDIGKEGNVCSIA